MKMKKTLTSFIVAFLLSALWLSSVSAVELKVFAAASLTDAMRKVGAMYEKAGGDKVVFNFGASSTLARQIEEGAPADLFVSADEIQADKLDKAGLLLHDTRVSLLSNLLVIVVPKESKLVIQSPGDLLGDAVKRISMGEPRTVPIGVYAKAYLVSKGLWARLESKVVPTENVRSALAAVETWNVEAGFVYRTDALISRKVRIAYTVPAGDGPKVSYPFAVVKGTENLAASKKFLEYLGSKDALGIFEQYGFAVK